MKTPSAIGHALRLAARSGAFSLLLTVTAQVTATDMNAVFEQGRAAFYRGDHATAQRLLTAVARADPKHAPTKALLWQINAAKPPPDTLQQKYAAVKLPKVDLVDVTLAESLQALTILTKNATDGKMQPNFILLAQDKASAKVTLSLTNIPLTEALTYITQLTSTKARWDNNGVIIGGLAD